MFSWDDVENIPDLKRLSLVLNYIPDEKIVQAMEKNHGNGRDDFPVRPMWNEVIAGIVFQHESIESLIRELSRNPSSGVIATISIWARCSSRSSSRPPASPADKRRKKCVEK